MPVIWVGLPAIRGTRSTADTGYLNDLYRSRSERAGVDYVDVWDGFVDEAGKYSSYGPDYEGQIRRLRSGDGVYFTKAGARKLAHYVEREIRRYMANHAVPVALPSGPIGPTSNDGMSTERPLAGPVVPLTTTPTSSEVLLGAAGSLPSRSDAIAARVLVRGEPLNPPAGRADDFTWPMGSDAYAKRATARQQGYRTGQGQRHRAIRFNRAACGVCAVRNPSPRGGGKDRGGKAGCRTEDQEREKNRRQAGGRRQAEADPAARKQAASPVRQRAAPAGIDPVARADIRRVVGRAIRLVQIDTAQRGSVVDPIRNLSTACAHCRPSRIAHTTSDWPRRISPAANTLGIDVW